jgi:L-cysteine S-thiosulfotransferase
MKRPISFMLAGLLISASFIVHAGREEDRLAMIAHYEKELPNIKLEDYVLGALNMSTEAKAQYDDVMSFPPFTADVREGGILWEKPFRNGQRFGNCFKYEGINAAASYPYYDDAAGRVVTFENAVNDCLKINNEPELAYGSRDMALVTSYAKSLSDNARVKIKIKSPGAVAAYEHGKKLYYERRGQLNFACATCHVDNAGKNLRSEQLSMMVGQATHWPEFRAGTEPVTLQMRFVQCQKNTRAKPFELNSREYNDLEFFMTYMSNGLKMLTPVFRK